MCYVRNDINLLELIWTYEERVAERRRWWLGERSSSFNLTALEARLIVCCVQVLGISSCLRRSQINSSSPLIVYVRVCVCQACWGDFN